MVTARPAAESAVASHDAARDGRAAAISGRCRQGARLAVGPLAFAAFFLPWAHGPGPLAGEAYTGFELVGFAGRLQALELSIAQGAMLWAIRLAILAVVIAGTWQIVLAPWHHWHPVYHVSGWYLAAFAAVAVMLGVLRSGVEVPPVGLALLAAAGIGWVAGCARPPR